MAIIRLNAHGTACRLHGSTQSASGPLRRLARGDGPVIVMIHGFGYLPGHPIHCPHRQILGLAPQSGLPATASWPRGLGFGGAAPGEGLGIALGWSARGSLWGARRRAGAAGRALADIVTVLKDREPLRPVHVVAHSMGIEVATQALHLLPAGAMGRLISMTGASHHSRVAAALNTPAGRTVEFFNITSRENDLFDCLFEQLVTSPVPADRALGQGLAAANAVTLQLDCPETIAHLARLGAPVGLPGRRICHWSAYMRPGILAFYRALLRDPAGLTLDRVRSGLPVCPAPRWSRLFAVPTPTLPMPFAKKPS